MLGWIIVTRKVEAAGFCPLNFISPKAKSPATTDSGRKTSGCHAKRESGLEKIISARGRSTSIGFAAQVLAPEDRRTGEIFRHVEPEDLLKYGLIPEFVGRLPVVGTLHELDKPALIQILTQPRNAITRQYMKLFEYENVKLRFTDDALEAIAESALERRIGARGLRMIIEDLMLDLMYQVPNQKKVREVTITRDVVMAKDKPIALIEKAG